MVFSIGHGLVQSSTSYIPEVLVGALGLDSKTSSIGPVAGYQAAERVASGVR